MYQEKERKNEKGITLIALIITIIVLLILAGVSISLVVGENGILSRATDASKKTNEAKAEEERQMSIAEAAMNFENTEYEDKNGEKVTIPAGFAVSQVEGENTVEDGLVIIDTRGNEFVWIPVNDINEMAQCKASNGCNLELINNNLQCTTVGHETTKDFIVGKLYANEIFENFGIENKVYSETSGLREPSLVPGGDSGPNQDYDLNTTLKYYEKAGYSSPQSMLNGFKEEYKKITKSICKFKGFYVGRYEMSFSDADVNSSGINGIVQSHKGVIPISSDNTVNNMWYGMYKIAKGYNSEQDSVKSSMIYGSQYDRMLNWILEGKDKNKVKEVFESNKNVKVTGKNSNDVINNIYDLGGNLIEWTLEASGDSDGKVGRVVRGGSFNNDHSPSFRSYCIPTDCEDWIGSRITLYIKV